MSKTLEKKLKDLIESAYDIEDGLSDEAKDAYRKIVGLTEDLAANFVDDDAVNHQRLIGTKFAVSMMLSFLEALCEHTQDEIIAAISNIEV